ncbi:MAG: BRO-N domain-containing protein [Sarcina sp.]
MNIEKFRKSPKLILFYKEALIEFLAYRDKLNSLEIKQILDYDIIATERNIDNLLIKKFNGKEIHTLIWNEKPCWMGVDIAEILGYKEKSKAISQCIRSEEFEKEIDYDILHSDGMCVKHRASIKHYSQVTILYKKGLLGFINYAHMPIGKEFRKWLRKEVFNELVDLSVGNSIEENKFNINTNLYKKELNDIEKSNLNFELIDVLRIVEKILDEQDERKLEYLDIILKNL